MSPTQRIDAEREGQNGRQSPWSPNKFLSARFSSRQNTVDHRREGGESDADHGAAARGRSRRPRPAPARPRRRRAGPIWRRCGIPRSGCPASRRARASRAPARSEARCPARPQIATAVRQYPCLSASGPMTGSNSRPSMAHGNRQQAAGTYRRLQSTVLEIQERAADCGTCERSQSRMTVSMSAGCWRSHQSAKSRACGARHDDRGRGNGRQQRLEVGGVSEFRHYCWLPSLPRNSQRARRAGGSG